MREISPRDGRWDDLKGSADGYRDLYRGTVYDAYADRIDGCSGRLGFSRSINPSTGEVSLKLESARFCRVPQCPVCQWRRQLMWRAKAFKVMPKILEDYPTSRWLFLTLTVRNCKLEDLRTTLAWMNKSWARLSELKAFPGIGFLRATEVTRVFDCYDRSKYLGRHGSTWIDKWEKEKGRQLRLEFTDECHPHFHVLLMVRPGYFGKNYLTHEKWTQMWQKSLRVEYIPIVHIRAVSSLREANQGMLDAVLETIKYSVKPADVLKGSTNGDVDADREWLVELTRQRYKTKSIATGGLLKHYLKELENEPDDFIHTDELNLDDNIRESTSLMYQWIESTKMYIVDYQW